MTDRFRDRLSEYRDGELDADDAALVRAHLESCGECAEALAGLDAVAERAAGLPERRPETDLWPGIAARIAAADAESSGAGRVGSGRRRGMLTRRFALTVPQLAAAALTLASLSVAGAWLGLREGGSAGAERAADAAGTATLASSGEDAASAGSYGAAIEELERILFDPSRPLPPETEASIRRALLKIDRAIEDARRALEALPGDPYLEEHVTSTMRRKAEYLRRAVRLSQQG
jgi:predicted anti-sigma-YlaC factor YlaD